MINEGDTSLKPIWLFGNKLSWNRLQSRARYYTYGVPLHLRRKMVSDGFYGLTPGKRSKGVIPAYLLKDDRHNL